MNGITTRRESPWVGVGTTGSWRNYRDALHDCGLDFYVVPQDAYTTVTTVNGPDSITVPGIQVNMRPTDNKVMGVVSSNYGIVQNEDAFSMLEPFTNAGGIIVQGGMTEQGLNFMVLRMHEASILGDEYTVDVMAVNSFNGAFPCALIMVPTRIICQNMYRGLMGKGTDHVLRFRHGSQIEDRIANAKHAFSTVASYMDSFANTLMMAHSNKLYDSDIKHLVSLLFPYPKPGGTREMITRDKVDSYRREFIDKYYNANDNARFVGTGMGFVNAYMDYLSHREPTKNMQGLWADRRLSGLVSGNDIKPAVIKGCIS